MAGWPHGLIEIAEVIGEEAALKLSESFGGFRVHIPKSPAADSPLARAIGLEAAEKLARHAGGDRLYVPMGRPHIKKPAIAAAAGTVAEIARRFGVTERWARAVRSQLRPRRPTATESEDQT
jgi:hypothetical protein